jgi:hypothetical protein
MIGPFWQPNATSDAADIKRFFICYVRYRADSHLRRKYNALQSPGAEAREMAKWM